MNTLGDVKVRVRALVGDPMGDFCTNAYLTPLINQVYEEQTTELMADTGSSFDDVVADLLAVPAGTTDLSVFQGATMNLAAGGATSVGPLYGLLNPAVVKFKQAGQPEEQYGEATRRTSLPDTSFSAGAAPSMGWGGMQWEWRGGIVCVTPLQYVADLRIKGEFNFPALVRDSDVLQVHPRMGTATAYGTAALIGAERENAGYAEGYAEQASRVLIQINNMLVLAEQGTVTRIGRGSGRRNS